MNYEGSDAFIMGCIVRDYKGVSVVSFGYDLEVAFVVFQIIFTDRRKEGKVG